MTIPGSKVGWKQALGGSIGSSCVNFFLIIDLTNDVVVTLRKYVVKQIKIINFL